jgi:transposase
MAKAEDVFESKSKSKKSQADEEKDALLKAIGQLKVENDFLKDALR